jgi:hypothetical protein
MNKEQDGRREEKAPNMFDDSYDIRQFKRDLTSGQLRWLATILSVANVGLLVFDGFDPEGSQMYFPFRMKGVAVLAIMSLTLVIWLVLAFVNWRAWAVKRRREA